MDANSCPITTNVTNILPTNVTNMTATNVVIDEQSLQHETIMKILQQMEDEFLAANFVKNRLKDIDKSKSQKEIFEMLNEVMKKAKKNYFRFLNIGTLFSYIPALNRHLDTFDVQKDVNAMYGLDYASVENKERFFLKELKRRVPDRIEALYIYYFFCELFPNE